MCVYVCVREETENENDLFMPLSNGMLRKYGENKYFPEKKDQHTQKPNSNTTVSLKRSQQTE